MRARLATGFGDHGPLLRPMADLITLSDMVRGRFWPAESKSLRPYTASVDYPQDNPLSGPLMTVAKAIQKGLGLRVATVDFPGWETHVNQAPEFAAQTATLSQALIAFWRDPGPSQQDVSVVVTSEFDCRPQ